MLQFRRVWAASISDFWTINTVSIGHAWSFLRDPPCRFIRTILPHSEEKKGTLLSYVDTLVAQGAVISVPEAERFQGVYSPLFLVQKKNGSWRPVIDLTYLNRFIKAEKFKMETLATIQKAILPGDWMISVDLKDAYFHVFQ